MLIEENGQLSPSGIAYLRTAHQVRHDAAAIQRIFNPSLPLEEGEDALRNRWREVVVSEEAKLHLEVRPVRHSAGSLTFAGRPTAGLFASPDGSRIVISNRHFVTIFSFLAELQVLNVDDGTFQIGSPPSDLRQWTVARLLAYTLREGCDPLFAKVYEETHVHYLQQRFTDPLQMIPPGTIDHGSLQQTAMTLNQFRGVGDARLDYRTARSLRGNLPEVGPRVRIGAREWFRFLFPGFIGDIDSGSLHRCLSTARDPCVSATPEQGAKTVKDKQPDLIQILVPEQRIEVLDPTFRVLTKWHNFKSAFYASVLRALFGNIPGQTWAVASLDFRDRRRMMAIEGAQPARQPARRRR